MPVHQRRGYCSTSARRFARRVRRFWFAAAVMLLAGCSGGTEPTESVASVIISNTPTTPLLGGSTVQLAATAVSTTGGTIQGATFTWKSSDQALATVSTSGLVTAVGAGMVTITATAGGKDGTAAIDVRAGGPLGTAGGTLTLLNGAVTLNVPPNSLNQTVTLLFRPAVDPVQNPRVVPGTIIEIEPPGVAFFQGATLGLRYDAARVPAGVSEGWLQLYYLSVTGTWVLVRGSSVNVATRTVTGVIGGTGRYAVGSTGVDRIELGGPGLNGALYAGQTTQLSAQLRDETGAPLSGRVVTWRSSDPSRATVVDGLVTAVAQGSVTITAEAEGRSASTGLEVLTRPTADWSGATEWVTFQGNPSHTGFVPVTVDPVTFAERWVKTLAVTGVPLNPVIAPGNSVFISTNAYFGEQKAWGLNQTSGAQLWTYDFGVIHAVHPPAFGGHRVYLTTSGHADSYLFAFEAASGVKAFQSPYANQWSTYYAPVVLDQTVYMAGGNVDGMYAFDAGSGAERWFAATNQYNEWTPAVKDGLVYAYTGDYDPKVTVVSAATGALSYEIPDPHFSWDGWSMRTAPVLGGANNLLAVQGGRLISFDLAGRTVKWEIAGQFVGTVTVADGVLYTINGGRLEARREADGALLWSWQPAVGALWGTIVATRNIVFVRADGATYGIDVGARRQVWSYGAGGHLALSGQGVLLIARPDGRLSAVGVR